MQTEADDLQMEQKPIMQSSVSRKQDACGDSNMLLIQSVTNRKVKLQIPANANVSCLFTVGKKQVTDFINLTVDVCIWPRVRVGGGWCPPCGKMKSLSVSWDQSLRHLV